MCRFGPIAPLPLALVLLALGGAGGARSASPVGPPGYADDLDCTPCHAGLATSFREVAMSQAIARPTPENAGGPLGATFVHTASGDSYRMLWRGERLVFQRWQMGADGRPAHQLEIPVDWVLGSGRHARSYLFQTPSGEIFQLPIAWYAESGSWAMAPGFDRADHDGVQRRVRRECLGCHAAYPAIAPGSDGHFAAQVFPVELSSGIGCQRCHGPGAEHVRRAWAQEGDLKAVIVNPARLPAERREEICYQCHLQPSVMLPGVARLGEGDLAFRPGDRLWDRRVLIDVQEEGRRPDERFEINHHAYRLRGSRCFQASGGRLSCLSCHDPHRRPARAELVERVRNVCLGCHQLSSKAIAAHRDSTADCASCHLPKRRAQDVVHAVMTDHRIVRRAQASEALAPLVEQQSVVTDVELYAVPPELTAGQRELYRALAVARLAGAASPAAIDRLAHLLAVDPPPVAEGWLDLAYGELGRRRFAAAERALAPVLALAPGEPQAMEWLGLSRAGEGDLEGAIATLEGVLAAALAKGEARPDAEFNLGRLLLSRGDAPAAVPHLERALALRPNLAVAAFHLGRAELTLGHRAAGLAALRRALAIDPRHREARAALARAQEATP